MSIKSIVKGCLVLAAGFNLASCGDRIAAPQETETSKQETSKLGEKTLKLNYADAQALSREANNNVYGIVSRVKLDQTTGKYKEEIRYIAKKEDINLEVPEAELKANLAALFEAENQINPYAGLEQGPELQSPRRQGLSTNALNYSYYDPYGYNYSGYMYPYMGGMNGLMNPMAGFNYNIPGVYNGLGMNSWNGMNFAPYQYWGGGYYWETLSMWQNSFSYIPSYPGLGYQGMMYPYMPYSYMGNNWFNYQDYYYSMRFMNYGSGFGGIGGLGGMYPGMGMGNYWY